MIQHKSLIAGLETGGTKIVCGVSPVDDPREILDRLVIPTETPATAVARVRAFLADHHRDRGIAAAAVASFGPVDIIAESDSYGTLLNTPKIPWQGFNVHDFLTDLTSVPSTVVTDVDGSLVGERYAGSATDSENAAYITVGTGVGVNLMARGRLVHGFRHAELGHVVPRRHPEDSFVGLCPVHGDCVEGLASGTAIQARQQTQTEAEMTRYCAYYIGQLCSTLTLTGIPEKIIIGGGVSQRNGLLHDISAAMNDCLANYLAPVRYPHSETSSPPIVPPGLGGDAGVVGALRLAQSLVA